MGHGTRVNECCSHLHCAHYFGNYKRWYSHHRQRSKPKATCMLPVLTVPCKTSSPHLLVFAISRPIIPKRQPEQIHSLSPTGKFPPGAGIQGRGVEVEIAACVFECGRHWRDGRLLKPSPATSVVRPCFIPCVTTRTG